MFVVITCLRRILNLPPLILFGCQNLNIFGELFLGTGFFSPSSGPLYTLKNFFPSLKNFSHHEISFSLKFLFPSLLNATPLMASIKKVTNVCGSALTIMTGFNMMLKMIRSDALTAPTHLDTVHTTLSTER